MEHLKLDAVQIIELIKKTVRLAHTAKEQFLTECNQNQLKVAEGKVERSLSSMV